jgi:uncharacterized membrane protein
MKPFKVTKTLTINKPAAELYHYWHDFENLPRFMKHLQSVKVLDNVKSHWMTRGPLGGNVEWDAMIVEDWENQSIAWTSVEGADVSNSGFIRFEPLSHDRGTEIKVEIEYNPPAGAIGDALLNLFGESPKQQLGDDLNRFKMLMEAGEIATTEGQSRGHN